MLLQVGLEQGHGPGAIGVAEALRACGQQAPEQVAVRLGEQGGPPRAGAFFQGGGVVAARVGGQPVVDGAGRHPQPGRDGEDGLPRGDFKDGESAAVHPGVVGGSQLPLQASPLPVGQGQGVH